MNQLFATVLLLVATVTSQAHAADEASKQAIDRGYTTIDRAEWERMASRGDAEAQYRLGVVLKQRRLEHGMDTLLQSPPPLLHDSQKSTEQEPGDEAWPDPFAEPQGDAEPKPMTREETEARFEEARWFRLAAEQGHLMAQLELHEIVRYREQKPVEALMWLLLADRDEQVALRAIKPLHYELARKDMSPEQISAAEQRARDWRPRCSACERVKPRCPCWPGGASQIVELHNTFGEDPDVELELCTFRSAAGNHRLVTHWTDWETLQSLAMMTEVNDAATFPSRACAELSLYGQRILPFGGAAAGCIADLEEAAALLGCSP